MVQGQRLADWNSRAALGWIKTGLPHEILTCRSLSGRATILTKSRTSPSQGLSCHSKNRMGGRFELFKTSLYVILTVFLFYCWENLRFLHLCRWIAERIRFWSLAKRLQCFFSVFERLATSQLICPRIELYVCGLRPSGVVVPANNDIRCQFQNASHSARPGLKNRYRKALAAAHLPALPSVSHTRDSVHTVILQQ